MDIPEQSPDPTLDEFDKWLKHRKIAAPADLLDNIRAYLLDASPDLDAQIDDLFRQDSSLYDEQMIWKIRGRLSENPQPSTRFAKLAKWLAPMAAAATLTLALISFQSEGPRAPQDSAAQSAAVTLDAVDVDEDMIKILALATNLGGTGDVTKLEAVENLSFLFE